MHAARGATNRVGRQIALADACGSPPGCSAPLRGRLLAMATLLHHWAYAASINIPDAIRRRFLGVVGLARQPVTLMVKALQAPFRLALCIKSAKLSSDHNQSGRPDLNNVPAVTSATIDPNEPDAVLIDNVQPALLAAVGITPPLLSDGPLTNKVVMLQQAASSTAEPTTVLQQFSDSQSSTIYFVRFRSNGAIETRAERVVQAANDAQAPAPAPPAPAPPAPAPAPANPPVPAPNQPPAPAPAVSFSPYSAATYPALARLLPADFPHGRFSELSALDDLCKVASLTDNVPADAAIPANSASARLHYLNEQLQIIMSAGISVRSASSSSWDDIFAAFRTLKSAFRNRPQGSLGLNPATGQPASSSAPAPAPAPLDSSFTRLAAHHTVFAMAHQQHGAAPAQLDETAIAAQQAAVLVDKESSLPAAARPLEQAANSLVPLSRHGDDPVRVGQLGDALRSLDPTLVRLSQVEGAAINVNSSECLSNVVRNLNTAREAMINALAAKLRAELRIDGPILTDARSNQLKQAASLIYATKISKVTEGMLFGTDASSLFYSLQHGHPERTFKTFRTLQATAALMESTRTSGFFAAAEAMAESLLVQHHASATDVADFISERLILHEREYSRFIAGKLALRPAFSAAIFETAAAVDALARIRQQAVADKRAREAVTEEVQRQLGLQPTSADSTGQLTTPATKKQKKKAKGDNQAANAIAAAATLAQPPSAVTPPPLPQPPAQHRCWNGKMVDPADHLIHVNDAFAGSPVLIRPEVDELRQFSAQNGNKCWDFCMRGQCVHKRNKPCGFVHQPL